MRLLTTERVNTSNSSNNLKYRHSCNFISFSDVGKLVCEIEIRLKIHGHESNYTYTNEYLI